MLGWLHMAILSRVQEQHFQHTPVWDSGTQDRDNAWGLQMMSDKAVCPAKAAHQPGHFCFKERFKVKTKYAQEILDTW